MLATTIITMPVPYQQAPNTWWGILGMVVGHLIAWSLIWLWMKIGEKN